MTPEALQVTGESLSAAQLLRAAARCFDPARMVFASSLSAEDQVLTWLLATEAPAIRICTIDTGRLPEETQALLAATTARFGMRYEVLRPDAQAVAAMVAERGEDLFRRSVADRRRCCRVRKVEPLQRHLAGCAAWLTGCRRGQSAARAALSKIDRDPVTGLYKLNPLADWTEAAVWETIRREQIPYNALHDCGYRSIGCAPCTRAVAPGEDVRAGRWWWETEGEKECGLHH